MAPVAPDYAPGRKWKKVLGSKNYKYIDSYIQGRSQKFVFGGIKLFLGGGGIKLLNSRSYVIFTP